MCICFVPPNQVQANVGQLLKWTQIFDGPQVLKDM
jgi:hypothetical protein